MPNQRQQRPTRHPRGYPVVYTPAYLATRLAAQDDGLEYELQLEIHRQAAALSREEARIEIELEALDQQTLEIIDFIRGESYWTPQEQFDDSYTTTTAASTLSISPVPEDQFFPPPSKLHRITHPELSQISTQSNSPVQSLYTRTSHSTPPSQQHRFGSV